MIKGTVQTQRQKRKPEEIWRRFHKKGDECLNCLEDKKKKKKYFPGTVEGGIKLLTGNTSSGKSLCKGWVHETHGLFSKNSVRKGFNSYGVS